MHSSYPLSMLSLVFSLCQQPPPPSVSNTLSRFTLLDAFCNFYLFVFIFELQIKSVEGATPFYRLSSFDKLACKQNRCSLLATMLTSESA